MRGNTSADHQVAAVLTEQNQKTQGGVHFNESRLLKLWILTQQTEEAFPVFMHFSSCALIR